MRIQLPVFSFLIALVASMAAGPAHQSAHAQSTAAPRFQVDPTWPLELPNNWIFGSITGVYVDSRQHVWVTHLPETLTEEQQKMMKEFAEAGGLKY